MVTVRGLQTTLGEFGFIKKGDVLQMSQRRADMMAEKGHVEIISEDDGQPEPEKEIKGGVRIKDHRGQTTFTDEIKKPKQTKAIKIGPSELAGAEGNMPGNYEGKVILTDRGPAIVGQQGPELVNLPDELPSGSLEIKIPDEVKLGEEPVKAEPAEPAKPEQAEVAKSEPKETKKKEYK